MAASTKTATDEAKDGVTEDTIGEIAKEKVIAKPDLGGSFTFRLPHALDELAVLRRRAEIVGVSEILAGAELVGYSHALAMFHVYCVHQAPDFDLEKLDTLDDFMEMMEEVRDWHETFRQRVGRKKAQSRASKS